MTNEQVLLDRFAEVALAALIAKIPLLDIEGEIGQKVSEESMREIKKQICKSAYEYASYMFIARKESRIWLNDNLDKL